MNIGNCNYVTENVTARDERFVSLLIMNLASVVSSQVKSVHDEQNTWIRNFIVDGLHNSYLQINISHQTTYCNVVVWANPNKVCMQTMQNAGYMLK